MTTPAIIDDDDIERDICGDIVSFLERDDVIGYDADRAEMKRYAEKLVNIEGCHSVEIIERKYTPKMARS
jgi:hypothetical protein